MDDYQRFILTLSCEDRFGVVATVASFLRDHRGFIIESAQFGDPTTKQFFMRTVFESRDGTSLEAYQKAFNAIAESFGMDWAMYNASTKPRVLVAVTKDSHCLSSILNRVETGSLPVEVPAIISNHEHLKHAAERDHIPYHHLPVTPDTKPEQEAEIQSLFKQYDCELLVLARYMQILSDDFCRAMAGHVINIHHSFLPGFKGANPYRQAYDRGVKLIGATAHFATSDLDEGPIIEQEVTRVTHSDSPAELKRQGQDIESQVLIRAIRYYAERRIIINGNKTVVFR